MEFHKNLSVGSRSVSCLT